jgi:clan AA aspartic protease
MRGFFSDGKPKIELTVMGLDDKIKVPALVDTGFNGALMLSLPAALQIGLRLSNMIQVELADGSIKKEFVFEGKVILDQETVPVDILLTSSDESLVGTTLLQNQSLKIDFNRQTITLDQSPTSKIVGTRGKPYR